jgi:flagellar biosynthesis protein FliR
MNELLKVNWNNFIALAFICVRIAIIFAVIPFFSAQIVPRRVTAMIAFFLSLVLMPVVPAVQVQMTDLNLLSIVFIMLHEMLIGLCIGLSIDVIFAGVQIAGELIGFQIGFSIANVVDPTSGITSPIISNVLYISAMLLFLSFGGHHMLIKALVESFQVIPIGDTMVHRKFLMAVIEYSGQMFIIGTKVAAPIIGITLLINIALAVISRALPQMNVFIVSFPLTIAVGLAFTALVIQFLPMLMEGYIGRAFSFVSGTMRVF